MTSISDDQTLQSLVARLRQLRPDSPRHWGTLTAAEMLCHLGDAHESVLGRRVPPGPPPSTKARPLLKWLILYSPVPWPRGVPTRPGVDPKAGGTRPDDFEEARERAIESLTSLATADPATLSACHFKLGPMTAQDWSRWAYLHVSHHLRQFGLGGATLQQDPR
jgi:hypothetical protein